MRSLLLLVFVLLALCPSALPAATYYVENKGTAALNQLDEGSAAWTNALNIATPCSPETAMVRAVAGDVVQFRGGTYPLDHTAHSATFYWYNGSLNPENSGTSSNPITFQAYPDERPIMDVAILDTTRGDAAAFGVNSQDWIVYDGFKVIAGGGTGAYIGSIKLMVDSGDSFTGGVVRNCEFDGGDLEWQVTNSTNWVGVFIQNCDQCTVANSLFYDIDSVDEYHNVTGVIAYHNTNITIKNNEIYGSSNGIYLKSDNNGADLFNNYIHDNFQAFFIAAWTTDYNADDVSIYNNVIAHIDENGIESETDDDGHANNLDIHNNTIFDIGTKRSIHVLGSQTGYESLVYNNIIDTASQSIMLTSGGNLGGKLAECDHNGYVDSIIIYDGWTSVCTTLSCWQSSGYLADSSNPGTGSVVSSAPGFTNASGTMSELSDFVLLESSPFYAAGRAGADMGADISLVGTGWTASEPTTAATEFFAVGGGPLLLQNGNFIKKATE